MDIVFGPDGNFDEVYLYEELMEADLHAIVRRAIILIFHSPLILAIERTLFITFRSALANRSRTRTSSLSSTKRSAV